jgi:hypothetical protein
VLDGLLVAVRAEESRVLVVHGEPGVGKPIPELWYHYLCDVGHHPRVRVRSLTCYNIPRHTGHCWPGVLPSLLISSFRLPMPADA